MHMMFWELVVPPSSGDCDILTDFLILYIFMLVVPGWFWWLAYKPRIQDLGSIPTVATDIKENYKSMSV
jgi:hypothetical protein